MAANAYAVNHKKYTNYPNQQNDVVPNTKNKNPNGLHEFSVMVMESPKVREIAHRIYPSITDVTPCKKTESVITNKVQEVILRILISLESEKSTQVIIKQMKRKDEKLLYHSFEVMCLTVYLGCFSGYTVDSLYELGMAAILHDIGTIFIKKEILEADHKPTLHEIKQIRRVPELSYILIKRSVFANETILEAIHDHQENYIGNGYPNAKRSCLIHPYAMLIHVADDYDTIISNINDLKQENSKEYAIDYILRTINKRYSQKAVDCFIKLLMYKTGSSL